MSAWQQVSGKLKQISVGSASHIWGVNASNLIYRYTNGAWETIGGSLKHVSVGTDGAVFGVNVNDTVYQYDHWTSTLSNKL